MNKDAKQKDYSKYEDEIEDIDEIEGTDIKINPDFYIHRALLSAQKALIKDNTEEGLLQYRSFIEHIEVLCRAAKMLPDNYQESLTTFKTSEEYTKAETDLVRSVRLANKKLELIMAMVFSSKVSTSSLKM